AVGGERVPTRERCDRPIEERRERRPGPQKVLKQGSGEAEPRFVAPLAVFTEPLDPVKRRIPVAPGELRPGRVRVCDDAKPAEAPDVLDNGAGLAAGGRRSRLHAD